jgi:peptidyl-prolyl cis-trans isomerase-like 4
MRKLSQAMQGLLLQPQRLFQRCGQKLLLLHLSDFAPPVSKDFIAKTGDPTASGTGGESLQAYITPDAPRYFTPELVPRFKHTQKGTVSMAVAPSLDGKYNGGCGSQFFVTLGDSIEYLDGKHAVFGHVVEGFDTLDKLNEVFTDQEGRPLKDVRIRHVVILGQPMVLGELQSTATDKMT